LPVCSLEYLKVMSVLARNVSNSNETIVIAHSGDFDQPD
jgi:hypothetical protein